MTFHVKQNMNCSVENIFYALRCNGCDEIYIGQTGYKLRDPSARKIPLSGHLETCCKNELDSSSFLFHELNCVDTQSKEKQY